MKIVKVEIQNFRLLKDTTIDLEEDTSIVIGKNNCGKTSFLEILNKFIKADDKNNFKFDDFNIDIKNKLMGFIVNPQSFNGDEFLGISLRLFIEYGENDNLSNIGNHVIMDLDPNNNMVVIAFEYGLKDFQKLTKDFKSYLQDQPKDNKEQEVNAYQKEILTKFLKRNISSYFRILRKSLFYNVQNNKVDEKNFVDLEKPLLESIINFKFIDAKRGVSNKHTDKNLSSKSADIYKKNETDDDESKKLTKTLVETDERLDEVYQDIFKDIIKDVQNLGGMQADETKIKIRSSLQGQNLLENNTTVMYEAGNDNLLPENYNGLGYMNLMSIIFDIYIRIHEFQKKKSENAANINILFIEEPEVHTHPQMQYIFINNIKSLIKKYKGNIDLQTIITTHSAHIIAESNFDDIKYFKKETTGIVSKNLANLQKEYADAGNDAHYRFLKKYLTLNRSELFFADKVIFFEGSTERILLPAIMKKVDDENSDGIPLLSQNISVIEVGNYSHIFEKFIAFIGIKALIITDIDTSKDTVDGDTQICQVSEGTKTTNASLKHWYKDKGNSLESLKAKSLKDKELKIDDTKILCIYQIEEKNSQDVKYHARSFEDAFIHINKDFIADNTDGFFSLTNKIRANIENKNAWDIAKSISISKKTDFAIDILLNDNGKSFQIPTYIKEGLTWLKED